MSISGTPFLKTKQTWSYLRKQLGLYKKNTYYLIKNITLNLNHVFGKTGYTDLTGFLDISGKAVRCPACNTGIIEVNEIPQGHNEDYIPASYLDFILSNW